MYCHLLCEPCVRGYYTSSTPPLVPASAYGMIGKGVNIVLNLLGQKPFEEVGFCGFVVEFGVSGDMKQLSAGVSVSGKDMCVGSSGY